MRRFAALLAVALLMLAMTAVPGLAGEHNHEHDVPEHPHVMLHNFEVIDLGDPDTALDDVVEFDRCIDLADNRPLPLEAHHHSLHTGTAGFGNPDVGITRAGHVVIPLQPFPGGLPFEDCEDVEAFASS